MQGDGEAGGSGGGIEAAVATGNTPPLWGTLLLRVLWGRSGSRMAAVLSPDLSLCTHRLG